MFIFGSGNQATFQSVFSGKSPELIARERERERERGLRAIGVSIPERLSLAPAIKGRTFQSSFPG